MSALSQEENQLLAYQLGADDYIIKPFQLSLLHAKVIAMIKRDQKKEKIYFLLDTFNWIVSIVF